MEEEEEDDDDEGGRRPRGRSALGSLAMIGRLEESSDSCRNIKISLKGWERLWRLKMFPRAFLIGLVLCC